MLRYRLKAHKGWDMSASELPANGVTQTASSPHNLLLAGFFAAIFISAALLFAVEPMFTKMVLPRLGGAAAVWSVAMVFFQATLLAGYAYAHLLTRFAPGRASVLIHLALMLIACSSLPLHLASGWVQPPAHGEAFWLLGLFTVSIGLPFFALAANGPLMQAWFVRTDHPSARDPYFLFAASNVGSFIALISYPIVVEPFLRLGEQTWLWTVGFYVLILLIAACGVLLLRSAKLAPATATVRSEETAPPTWRDRLAFVGLAAVPSGLLLAVTLHISTDAAAIPLFWVVPLAIYLLTFVIAFQSRPFVPHSVIVRAFPFVILGLAALMIIAPFSTIIELLAVHLSAFFVIGLLCHGELARRRPAPKYLTAFYLLISAGGMIGGIAVGLIAPQVFNWVAEYPLLIALSILCMPGLALPTRGAGQYLLFGALVVAAALLTILMSSGVKLDDNVTTLLIGALLGLTVYFWRAWLAFAAIISFVLILGHYQYNDAVNNFVVRNFFGVLSAAETADGRFRILWHGGIGQGAQRIRDREGKPVTGRPEMISEFQAGAGIAQTFDAVRARVGGPISYAVIGLGTGTLTCQARPEDSAIYYELDPDVIRIARDPKLFNFVLECRPNIPIVQGDARLTIVNAPDASYDLIVVDAFIGAAIPIHLLTKEAIAVYLRKLKPNGIVALHVSNYHLELATVVAGAADANGAITRLYDGGDVQEDASEQKWVPTVAAVARKDEDFGAIAKSRFWPLLPPDPAQRVWTDDYSNVPGALVRRLRQRIGSSP
jgi:SAM-dependent methyltransferase